MGHGMQWVYVGMHPFSETSNMCDLIVEGRS